MGVEVNTCFNVPGIAYCVIRFFGEPLVDHHLVDVNFFTVGVEQVNVNRLIPCPERNRKQNTSYEASSHYRRNRNRNRSRKEPVKTR